MISLQSNIYIFIKAVAPQNPDKVFKTISLFQFGNDKKLMVVVNQFFLTDWGNLKKIMAVANWFF